MGQSFNANWSVKPKVNRFLELMGSGTFEPQTVTLPHDAMIGTRRDPSASHMNAYFPDGVWEYTKTFDVPLEWRDRRVHVQFEGVYRDAAVYVNEDFAGSEPHGYNEFMIDLDPFLNYGAVNTIKVECRAGDDSRWYSGAGIYRPVNLWVQQPVRLAIDGAWITTPEVDDDGAVVEIAAEVHNDTAQTVTVRVAHELRDPADAVVGSAEIPVSLRPHSSAIARQRLHIPSAALWSIDTPNLYHCTTTLTGVGDNGCLGEEVTTFGIRRLQLDARHGLRINGETVKLRGACIHHDNGPIGAATIGRAEERRVEILKAAGFNAIRSSHNPTSRALLDACDRLGVVVIDETWDTWTEGKRDHDHSLRFDERWRHDVASMVRKDRNHPSVVMYSTGNEITEVGSALGAARGREIAEFVRSLDPTRYVTNAIQPVLAIRDMIPKIRELATQPMDPAEMPTGVNSMMTMYELLKDKLVAGSAGTECMEEIAASLDIAGYNYLDVRYVMDGEAFPNRVIVGSETYVTALHRAWPLITAHPHLLGDFTWTGWDYLGEVGIGRTEYATDDEVSALGQFLAPYPWLLAHAGDIDVTGIRRAQSYYREIVFGLRTEPYIGVLPPSLVGRPVSMSSQWSWADVLPSWSWDGHEGKPVNIEVYSAADEVELLCNGTVLGRQPTGEAHRFRTTFETIYTPGELTAVAYSDGTEVGRTTLATATGPLQVTVTPDRSEIIAHESDLVYVAVSLTGTNEVLRPAETRQLTVNVGGPGLLQGFASADPTALEPYPTNTCTTYNGRALAVIRPTGPGLIEVAVIADDLATGTCAVTVVAP